LEVAKEALLNEITSLTTNAKYARLKEMADAEGKTVDEVVSELVSEGLDARYLIQRTPGKVIPIAGLKSSARGTES